MWEEDLDFPGSRRESTAIIDSPDPQHPPTPPHTDSSHSSEQDRALYPMASLDLYAPPGTNPFAISYSFDDVSSKVRRSLYDDSRESFHIIPSPHNSAQTPTLTRNIERPPTNPYDHSLLETIYNEMHASRFVNLEPLSLLTNQLPLHFKGLSWREVSSHDY